MLSLKEQVGQKIIAGFDGLMPPEYILDWLANGHIGGVVLFNRNIDSPDQLAELTQACYQAATYPILIAIDQEGGVVSRLTDDFTESPGAMALGAAGDAYRAEQMSAVLAAEMHTLGINWNLAPVADLALNIENTSLGARAAGVDPAKVSELVAAQVRGLQDGGVAACAKHFPGLGSTTADTHHKAATSDITPELLTQRDLVPFRAAIEQDVASVMLSHARYKRVDAQSPASLSAKMVKMLRDDLNFHGIITTDCLEMSAIDDYYSLSEAAIRATLSGVDLLFVSHTQEKQQAAWMALFGAAVSGLIPEDVLNASLARITAVKETFPINATSDFNAVHAIGNPEHRQIAVETARAGLVQLQSIPGVLPLSPDSGDIVLIEFRPTPTMTYHQRPILAKYLGRRLPQLKHLALPTDDISKEMQQQAHELISEARTVILATRNAHLQPDQLMLAQQLLNVCRQAVLVCLQNPYDAAELTGANTVFCSCGDSRPSLEAVIGALMGDFEPGGTLPVALTVLT